MIMACCWRPRQAAPISSAEYQLPKKARQPSRLAWAAALPRRVVLVRRERKNDGNI
jgi:hypothetical protein